MTILCVDAYVSSKELCVDAECATAEVLRIIRGMAKNTPTAKSNELKRLLKGYLLAVQLAKGWTQTEIANKMRIGQSNVSRALKEDQVIDYPRLRALSKAAGLPIPAELEEAYEAAALAPAETPVEMGASQSLEEIAALATEAARTRNPAKRQELLKRIKDITAAG